MYALVGDSRFWGVKTCWEREFCGILHAKGNIVAMKYAIYVGNSVGNINNGNKKRSPVIDVTPYLYYGSFICLL